MTQKPKPCELSDSTPTIPRSSPQLPDDQLRHLVAVLADRFEVMPAI
jgi:hypothetical protein